MSDLHIFALNEASDLRHTHLTRARGEAGELPPLADWLGAGGLDTDRVELFPVADLDQMRLSDYVATAFGTEGEIPRDTRARLDALDGSVLLVPDRAVQGAPKPGAALTHVASLPLARADHSADLPKAAASPLPGAAPVPEPAAGGTRPTPWPYIAAAALVFVLLLAFFFI